MNLEFSALSAIVVVCWALALPLDSLLSILIAALIFFSRSVPVDILFLLSLNLIAFLQATLGGKKSGRGQTQKRFGIVFFGSFCALMGSALPQSVVSYPLMFFGLLFTVTNSITSFFFAKHYENLSIKSYLQSVIIPSIAAINILLKIKAGVKADYTQLWDITLLILGLSTFFLSSLLSLAQRRLKAVWIYLSQAWVGMLLFLLVIDSETLTTETFAAYAILAVGTIMFLNLGSTLGGRYFSFAKITALGLPGTVGFTALFFALKLTMNLNIIWLRHIRAWVFTPGHHVDRGSSDARRNKSKD